MSNFTKKEKRSIVVVCNKQSVPVLGPALRPRNRDREYELASIKAEIGFRCFCEQMKAERERVARARQAEDLRLRAERRATRKAARQAKAMRKNQKHMTKYTQPSQSPTGNWLYDTLTKDGFKGKAPMKAGPASKVTGKGLYSFPPFHGMSTKEAADKLIAAAFGHLSFDEPACLQGLPCEGCNEKLECEVYDVSGHAEATTISIAEATSYAGIIKDFSKSC